jgi:uncharacterized membrane protein YfcA
MINIIWQAVLYVTGDPFFWASMGFTTMVGLFIGAVIYDGQIDQIRKLVFSLLCYVALLVVVNLTRALPDIQLVTEPHKPIASAVTSIIITLFYLFGMYLGVKLVSRAHKGRLE